MYYYKFVTRIRLKVQTIQKNLLVVVMSCFPIFGHQGKHGASDATDHYTGFAGIVFLFPERRLSMTNVTVSAKVAPEVAMRINQTGYSTSDVMQVGLEIFLGLTPEQQESLIWDHIQRKKRERALERYRNKRISLKG